MRNQAKKIAMGGMLAALAVVIMSLGGLIPMATFVCPMMCMVILQVVCKLCGSRVAWAWYGAVALLGILLGPDKEAAAVFAFLGYYPILKPRLDVMKLGLVLKILLFNGAVLIMYALLMNLFGMAEIAAEFQEMGAVMTLITLILGNVTFFLLDRLLGVKLRGKPKGRTGSARKAW